MICAAEFTRCVCAPVPETAWRRIISFSSFGPGHRVRVSPSAPTATLTACANERLSFDDPTTQTVTGMTPVLSEVDTELCGRDDFGRSTLDRSVDGQGIFFSSYRRPTVNMRPKYRMSSTGVTWGFAQRTCRLSPGLNATSTTTTF